MEETKKLTELIKNWTKDINELGKKTTFAELSEMEMKCYRDIQLIHIASSSIGRDLQTAVLAARANVNKIQLAKPVVPVVEEIKEEAPVVEEAKPVVKKTTKKAAKKTTKKAA